MTEDHQPQTEQSEDTWKPSCTECGHTPAGGYADLVKVPVHVETEDGYERIPMPKCRRCRLEEHGHDCPECGERHMTIEAAAQCCHRAQGEAPDCIECGRRMKRISWGYTADGTPTCEYAECEACGVAWGKYTGWEKPKENA